jgi:hypothetical protein
VAVWHPEEWLELWLSVAAAPPLCAAREVIAAKKLPAKASLSLDASDDSVC